MQNETVSRRLPTAFSPSKRANPAREIVQKTQKVETSPLYTGYAAPDNSPVGMLTGGIQSYISAVSTSALWVTPEVARSSPTVYACVRIIAKNIARMPCEVLDVSGSSPVALRRSELWRLLNVEPNPEMSALTLRETIISSAVLYGNGYGVIRRDAGGRPVGISYRRPDLMTRERDSGGNPVYRYWTGPEAGVIIQPYDVFHLIGPGTDGLLGEPIINLCREIIALEILATRYAGGYFKNGARPGGVIESPFELEDEAVKRLKERWFDEHGGTANASRVGVLDLGMKFVPITANPEESQLVELRQLCRQQIAAAFGVPPHMIGDTAKESYASAEQADQEFAKHTLGEWASRFEAEVKRKLIRRDQDWIARHNFNDLLRADMKTRHEAYAKAVGGPFMLANEARAAEGLPSVAGGDVLNPSPNVAKPDTTDDAGEASDVPDTDKKAA